MNVASLGLSKELFELSGWDDTYWVYQNTAIDNLFPREQARGMGFGYANLSAYDLGYLLDKIKLSILSQSDRELASIFKVLLMAENPANSLCKLAIELFKQGVLPQKGKEQ